MTLTVGSLFSGIGGMELGLERAGMKVKWQVEIDPWCRKVLAKHWPDVPKYGDITEIRELPYVDLVCGGFPCQPVSQAGKRKGQDDDRWLWHEFERIIRIVRPRYVLVENVAGLLSPGRGMGVVLAGLAACGFDAEWDSIPAAAVGAPHIRDRVFIFAYTAGEQRSIFQAAFDERRHVEKQGANWDASKWSKDRELVDLVPGVHPGSPADWWRAQSSVARSAHGIPEGLERITSYGNAVVPQVAEWLGRQIVRHAS